MRSSKWISTSIPESRWNEPLAQFSSVAYHVNNLVSPVLFNVSVKITKRKMWKSYWSLIWYFLKHVSECVETRARQLCGHRNRTTRAPPSHSKTKRRFQVYARRSGTKKSLDGSESVVQHRKPVQRRTATKNRKPVPSNQLSRIQGHTIAATISRMGPFCRLGSDHFYWKRNLVVWRSPTRSGYRKRKVQPPQGHIHRWCRSPSLRIIPRKLYYAMYKCIIYLFR